MRWAAVVAVSMAAAACSTVLGLEDHEPFPKDASAEPDAAKDATADAAKDAISDVGPDVTDAVAEDSAPPERVTQDLLALYTFDEGSGDKVKDVSGVSPPWT